jgi:histidine ammonia-lyase
MKAHEIDVKGFGLQKFWSILNDGQPVELSAASREKVVANHAYLQERIQSSNEAIYGVNTGFGSLCDTPIGKDDIQQLQHNLVMSHACGSGPEIDSDLVKAMMLLKIQNMALGHSAVASTTVERLVYFYNHDIIPVVYQRGSLGASGDLAPLAHMSLPMIGLGEVNYQGNKRPAGEVLKECGLQPLKLGVKEGLALLNGTQFMGAHAALALRRAIHLMDMADLIASLSMEAYDCLSSPYDSSIHDVRPHPGQLVVASRIRSFREGSGIMYEPKVHVQDPYSFRCVPQVHGASRDALDYIRAVVEREIGSVTDNPTVFHDEDKVISGGNFHGQPLALALDFMAIAVAEIGSISERRIYKLISGNRGLPAFLVAEPGLNSGFMIPQYTAASLVSANKQLCTPASVDTIDSSNGQEDHVSMGANAAVKVLQAVDHVERILGIELMNGAQALQFRRPLRSSEPVENLFSEFRKVVPFLERDEVMREHMEASLIFMRNFAVVP